MTGARSVPPTAQPAEAERGTGAPRAEDGDAVLALSGADEVRPLEELPVVLGRGSNAASGHQVCSPRSLPPKAPWWTRDSALEAQSESLVTRSHAGVAGRRTSSRLFAAVPDARHPRRERLPRRAALGQERVGDRTHARGGRLTASAVLEAMRSTEPGVMEYELGALAEFVFVRGGAFGPPTSRSSQPGRTSGTATTARRAHELEAGQLVLMDAAPDYRYYASDIGRMWPVDGIWEPWQLELYASSPATTSSSSRASPRASRADEVLAGAAEVMHGVLAGDELLEARVRAGRTGGLDLPSTSPIPSAWPCTTSASTAGRPFVPGHVLHRRPDAVGAGREALHPLRGHRRRHAGRRREPDRIRADRPGRDRRRDARAGALAGLAR